METVEVRGVKLPQTTVTYRLACRRSRAACCFRWRNPPPGAGAYSARSENDGDAVERLRQTSFCISADILDGLICRSRTPPYSVYSAQNIAFAALPTSPVRLRIGA